MKSQFSVAAAASLLVSIGAALPTLPLTYPQLRVRNDSETYAGLAERLATIVPKSKSCDVDLPDCRTNDQIAPLLVDGLKKWEINQRDAISAVIALTAFESDSYKYKRNMYPGRPGQGTSNMQMIKYNVKYAMEFPELHEKIKAIEITPENADAVTPEQQNELLDLVTPDDYNFGSGPWFLRTQCPSSIEDFNRSAEKGWDSYMKCVGVDANEEGRRELFEAALASVGQP